MFNYQRWHHSNWHVGEFGVCGEFIELVEGGKGKRKAPPYGIILIN